MRRVMLTLFGALCPLLLFAQASHFVEDASVRNYQLGHYYQMVTWDDSHYREFAYYETNENGAIKNFMNWRAAFPPGFNKEDAKKYPTILMLHGAGESGRVWTGRYQYTPEDPEYDNNGRHLLFAAVEHYVAMNKSPSHPRSFPGIVIFPQVSANGAWVGSNLTMATRILEYMIEEYDVDPFRLFVHGLSNGAKGVWQFSSERPDLFSAALSMSGVGVDIDAMTDSLLTTPVWIFQGENDTNPSPGWSRQWKQMLEAKGGKPRYTLYEDTGHGTWKQAYAEPDFFSWILQHDKRQIYYFADTTFTPTAEKPLKLGFSAGFLGYQWTRNGQDIPNARGRYYTATLPGRYTVKFKQKLGSQQWAESFVLDLEGPGDCVKDMQLSLTASNKTSLPMPADSSLSQHLDLLAASGYERYAWYKNGELVKVSTSHKLNLNDEAGEKFKPSDAGSYTVVVEEQGGCTSFFSEPVRIRWFDATTDVSTFEPMVYAAGDTALPVPDSLPDKSLYLLAPDGFTTYQWFKNGQLLADQTGARLQLNNSEGTSFSKADTGRYTVKVVNANGTASLVSDEIQVTLNDLDSYLPTLNATNATDLPLPDSAEDKSLSLLAPQGFNYYLWYKNGDLLKETSENVLTLNDSLGGRFTEADTGIYTVVVAMAKAYPSQASDPVEVTYDDLPFYEPYLYATGPTELPLDGTENDKTLNLVAPEGYAVYRWYKDSTLVLEGSSHQLELNDAAGELFRPEQAGVYHVVLVNGRGRASLPSNTVPVTYSGSLKVYSPPAGITVMGLSSSVVEMSWEDTDYEAGYEVWRARKNTFDDSKARARGYPAEPLQLVASLPVNVTSFTDSLLRPGAGYEYQIKAIPPGEEQFATSEPYVITTLPDSVEPGIPIGLKVDSVAESAILLSWSAPADDDVVFAYEVFEGDEKIAEVWSETEDDTDPTLATPGPATTYLATGLQARTEYHFKVRAADYQGNDFSGNFSTFSETVIAKVILGVSENEMERTKLMAYPNPFSDRLFLELPADVAPGQPILLYNHSGQLIKEAGFSGRESRFSVDLPDLPDGYYILHLGNYSLRVIKRN